MRMYLLLSSQRESSTEVSLASSRLLSLSTMYPWLSSTAALRSVICDRNRRNLNKGPQQCVAIKKLSLGRYLGAIRTSLRAEEMALSRSASSRSEISRRPSTSASFERDSSCRSQVALKRQSCTHLESAVSQNEGSSNATEGEEMKGWG